MNLSRWSSYVELLKLIALVIWHLRRMCSPVRNIRSKAFTLRAARGICLLSVKLRYEQPTSRKLERKDPNGPKQIDNPFLALVTVKPSNKKCRKRLLESVANVPVLGSAKIA